MLSKSEAAIATEALVTTRSWTGTSEAEPATRAWVETALAVMFTVTAVLAVSFVAVVTGLV